MACQTKAECRALDARCSDLASPAACRTVRVLREMPAESKIGYAANYIRSNCDNLIRCALEAGVSAGGYDSSCGLSLLSIAAQAGSLRPLQTLLKAGCDPNAHDAHLGNTALMESVMHKQPKCCRVLRDVSDLSLSSAMGYNAFHMCVNTANQECFDLLLPCVGDVDARSVPGVDEHGAPLSGSFSRTALMIACERGQHDMVKALLKRGASRTAIDSKGCSCAFKAAERGHLSCLNYILGNQGRYKLSPEQLNSACNDGWTALHASAFFGHAKCCGLLIAAGARLDVRMPSGHTALMLAQQEHRSNKALLDVVSGRGPAVLPGTCCDRCGAMSGADGCSVKICDGCYAARFCGAACAAAAWPTHKVECRRKAAERKAATQVRIIF